MNGQERPINKYYHHVETNIYSKCPPEILAQIIGTRVTYMTFDGYDVEGVIEVHKDLEQDVRDFFALAYDIGFPISRVSPASKANIPFDDDDMMSSNMSSGFNYRTIAGTNKLSLHSLGRAIDINPRLNPYRIYKDGKLVTTKPANWQIYNIQSLGGILESDHQLVEFMRSRNWNWGGDWTPESGRIDLHHFEKAL